MKKMSLGTISLGAITDNLTLGDNGGLAAQSTPTVSKVRSTHSLHRARPGSLMVPSRPWVLAKLRLAQ